MRTVLVVRGHECVDDGRIDDPMQEVFDQHALVRPAHLCARRFEQIASAQRVVGFREPRDYAV